MGSIGCRAATGSDCWMGEYPQKWPVDRNPAHHNGPQLNSIPKMSRFRMTWKPLPGDGKDHSGWGACLELGSLEDGPSIESGCPVQLAQPRIDHYDGRDATEVMHAFHSAKGWVVQRRLVVAVEAAEVFLAWGEATFKRQTRNDDTSESSGVKVLNRGTHNSGNLSAKFGNGRLGLVGASQKSEALWGVLCSRGNQNEVGQTWWASLLGFSLFKGIKGET